MRAKNVLKSECRKINEVLKAEAKELRLGTKKSLGRLAECENDASAKSYWAEMEFREYVRRQLEIRTSVNAVSVINGGARLLGLSPVTTKRYLAKLRSERGPFSGLGDIVVINSHYVPKEDDEYWEDEDEKPVSLALPREEVERRDDLGD